MRIHLELDHEDGFRFLTTRSAVGPYRALQIKINGRPFATWYRLDDQRMSYDENYMKNVDQELARQFERMVEKLLAKAIADAPEGVDLLESDANGRSTLR